MLIIQNIAIKGNLTHWCMYYISLWIAGILVLDAPEMLTVTVTKKSIFSTKSIFIQKKSTQECIPVGCVRIAWFSSSRGGDQVWPGTGVVVWPGQGVGDLSQGVVTSPPSDSLPPPPVDRMTDTCENITFPRCATRTVIMNLCEFYFIKFQKFLCKATQDLCHIQGCVYTTTSQPEVDTHPWST